jgi:hypothetical protein
LLSFNSQSAQKEIRWSKPQEFAEKGKSDYVCHSLLVDGIFPIPGALIQQTMPLVTPACREIQEKSPVLQSACRHSMREFPINPKIVFLPDLT